MFGGVRENRRALPPEPATEPPPLDISSPQQGTPTRNLLRAPGHFRSTRSSQRTAMARERVGDSEQEKGAGVAFAKPALGTFSANRSRRRAPETDMAEQPAGSRSPSGLPFCCCHSSVQGYRTGPFQFQQPIPTGTPSRANDQCLDPFLPRMPHDVVPTLFAWLISHQPAVLFSHNEPATSNQPAVLFSQKNQHQPSATSQPNRLRLGRFWLGRRSVCLAVMRKQRDRH
jgi:hypothetical protein